MKNYCEGQEKICITFVDAGKINEYSRSEKCEKISQKMQLKLEIANHQTWILSEQSGMTFINLFLKLNNF